jgi:hypothetical protein
MSIMTIPSHTSIDQTTCRHEFVRIFQRRLKGLERRLVATKAYLPVGFKVADFGHLGEGSYCFCSRCRARLFPKRTAGEKAAAKAALAAEKALASAEFVADEESLVEAADTTDDTSDERVPDIHVEELELESTELEDLEEGSVAVEDTADENAET